MGATHLPAPIHIGTLYLPMVYGPLATPDYSRFGPLWGLLAAPLSGGVQCPMPARWPATALLVAVGP
jgi:hypothetical protein